MIRAAVFDIGGVLEIVDDDLWLDALIERWEGLTGVPPGTVASAPKHPESFTEAGLRGHVADVLGLADQHADQFMVEFWDAYCGTLDETMAQFVRELGGSLTVAALSNSGDGARREEEKRYRFSELFDELVYSHEVGMQKPDAAIYDYTQRLLGVQPEEIVFLDDRRAAVDGAIAAGWNAVLHSSTPASIAAVRSIIAAR